MHPVPYICSIKIKDMNTNLNPRWTVQISYAPLTTFSYDFASLNSARNFAGLMARDNSVKVQLIKNI